MIDFQAELVAATDIPADVQARLRAMGIPEMVKARYPGPLGYGRIQTTGNWYEPDPDGETSAIIAPVWSGDSYSMVMDLVAWFPDRPGKWWSRASIGDLMGWANFDYADIAGEPLTLAATPQSWLASNGEGCCVLHWPTMIPKLRSISRLDCETLTFARFVRQQLRQPPQSCPDIHVRVEEGVSAA